MLTPPDPAPGGRFGVLESPGPTLEGSLRTLARAPVSLDITPASQVETQDMAVGDVLPAKDERKATHNFFVDSRAERA